MENSVLRKTFALLLFSVSHPSEFVIQNGPMIIGILFGGMEVEGEGTGYLYFFSYGVSSVLPAVTLPGTEFVTITDLRKRAVAGVFGDGTP